MTTPRVIAQFTKCPHCGSARQLAVECLQETAEKPPGIPAIGIMGMRIMKVLSAEDVLAILDVCPECGTIYCKAILRQPVAMQVMPGKQPFPGNGLVGGLN